MLMKIKNNLFKMSSLVTPLRNCGTIGCLEDSLQGFQINIQSDDVFVRSSPSTFTCHVTISVHEGLKRLCLHQDQGSSTCHSDFNNFPDLIKIQFGDDNYLVRF